MGNDVTVIVEPETVIQGDETIGEAVVDEVAETIEEIAEQPPSDYTLIIAEFHAMADRITASFEAESSAMREAVAAQTAAISDCLAAFPVTTPVLVSEYSDSTGEEILEDIADEIGDVIGDVEEIIPDIEPSETAEDIIEEIVDGADDVIPNRKLKWRAVMLGGSGGSGGRRR